MARQLETYSNIEVRLTVHFLWAKRFTNTEIHREISIVHGPRAISRATIMKWCQKFGNGRTDLTDAGRKVNNSEHPVYGSDLALWNFHVFGELKEHLGGKQFSRF